MNALQMVSIEALVLTGDDFSIWILLGFTGLLSVFSGLLDFNQFLMGFVECNRI